MALKEKSQEKLINHTNPAEPQKASVNDGKAQMKCEKEEVKNDFVIPRRTRFTLG